MPKIALVTGATGAIGKAIARQIAAAPDHEVVLIGRQGAAEMPVEEWADHTGTINYEIVCQIGPRMPRRYRP